MVVFFAFAVGKVEAISVEEFDKYDDLHHDIPLRCDP